MSPGPSRDFLLNHADGPSPGLPLVASRGCADNVSMNDSRTLLIVGHVPSANTQKLRDAVEAGALAAEAASVKVVTKTPFDTDARDVLAANALVVSSS